MDTAPLVAKRALGHEASQGHRLRHLPVEKSISRERINPIRARCEDKAGVGVGTTCLGLLPLGQRDGPVAYFFGTCFLVFLWGFVLGLIRGLILRWFWALALRLVLRMVLLLLSGFQKGRKHLLVLVEYPGEPDPISDLGIAGDHGSDDQ